MKTNTNKNNDDSWKATVALSFAAGVASMSLVWYVREHARSRRSRRKRIIKRRSLFKRNESTDSLRSFSDGDDYDVNATSLPQQQQQQHPLQNMKQSSSFIDTVIDAVEDIKSRIGELPAGIARRTHWPWETIHKNKNKDASSNNSIQQKSNLSNSNDGPVNVAQTENGGGGGGGGPTEKGDCNVSPELCIGSIFGLDVGGTLAKLVYFEKQHDQDIQPSNSRERKYHRAASAQATFETRQDHHHHHHHHKNHNNKDGDHSHHRRFSSMAEPLRARSFSAGVFKRELSTASSSITDYGLYNGNNDVVVVKEIDSKQHRQDKVHSSQSNDELGNLSTTMRQESLPDDVDSFATAVQYTSDSSDNLYGKPVHHIHFAEEEEKKDKEDPITPAGLSRSFSAAEDMFRSVIGGMKKSKSAFDLSMSQKSRDHAEALNRFYHFARKLDTYRDGVKDHKLSFYSHILGGEFHFIQFETRRMESAIDYIRANNLHLTIREMGATGGGAHKFAADWDQNLGIQMKKQEELDSLVAGMQFVLSTVVGECYTFRPRKKTLLDGKTGSDDAVKLQDQPDASPSPPPASVPAASSSEDETRKESCPLPPRETSFPSDGEQSFESESEENELDSVGADEWWWSRKVQRDAISYSSTYPYLLVTIGTGVSILRVDGPRKHERISGSTIGGGTYWGLIRLLTDLEDFEDVMRLAEHGDPSKVDMMVGDIYGNNKEALEKLGLPASLVASSFGKLVSLEDPAAGLKQEDLARALLLMVTNNIGQVAYLNAQLHKTKRIYFVGNFLRGNKLSQRRLSFAINYWSKGEMEALFLEHEGYFGALGAFLLSQNISLDGLQAMRRNSVHEYNRRRSSRQHQRSQTMENILPI